MQEAPGRARDILSIHVCKDGRIAGGDGRIVGTSKVLLVVFVWIIAHDRSTEYTWVEAEMGDLLQFVWKVWIFKLSLLTSDLVDLLLAKKK
jgi:hypothetical protein